MVLGRRSISFESVLIRASCFSCAYFLALFLFFVEVPVPPSDSLEDLFSTMLLPKSRQPSLLWAYLKAQVPRTGSPFHNPCTGYPPSQVVRAVCC